jgi:hypothetical protein
MRLVTGTALHGNTQEISTGHDEDLTIKGARSDRMERHLGHSNSARALTVHSRRQPGRPHRSRRQGQVAGERMLTLLGRRSELRGTYALADYLDEAMRWGV